MTRIFDGNGTQPQNPDDLEDGFDIDENDAGSIVAHLIDVMANGNQDDDGFKAEEFGAGNLNGLIASSSFSDNDDDGLQIEQNDAGNGILRLLRVITANNGDDAINSDGVRVIGG